MEGEGEGGEHGNGWGILPTGAGAVAEEEEDKDRGRRRGEQTPPLLLLRVAREEWQHRLELGRGWVMGMLPRRGASAPTIATGQSPVAATHDGGRDIVGGMGGGRGVHKNN
jgi:hypothetical protein